MLDMIAPHQNPYLALGKLEKTQRKKEMELHSSYFRSSGNGRDVELWFIKTILFFFSTETHLEKGIWFSMSHWNVSEKHYWDESGTLKRFSEPSAIDRFPAKGFITVPKLTCCKSVKIFGVKIAEMLQASTTKEKGKDWNWSERDRKRSFVPATNKSLRGLSV